MSKQEEIREGMWGIIDERLFNHLITEEEAMLVLEALLQYLHDNDVVIKVDRKLPRFGIGEKLVAVEPLIKEEGLDEVDWAALGNL